MSRVDTDDSQRNNKQIRLSGLIAIILVVAFATIGSDLQLKSTFADSGINANEARVLAVVNGLFIYDGKYYRAKSEYISQVSAYLNQDDVDLTAGQASSAISKIYGSIEEGVTGGYLYEVQMDYDDSEEDSEEDTSDVASTEEATEATTAIDNDGIVVLPTDDNGAIIVEKSSHSDSGIDLNENIWEEVIGYEGLDTGSLQDRPEEEAAGTKIIFDENSGELVVVVDGEPQEVEESYQILPDWVKIICMSITGISGMLTIATVIILAVNKCFVWSNKKKHGKRRGHTKRKKLRKASRWILTIALTLELISVFAGVTCYLGLFRQDTTMRTLNSCGFFRYAYNLYCDEWVTEEDTPMEYETFLFQAKQEIVMTLDGKAIEQPVLQISIADYLYHLNCEVRAIGIWMMPSMIVAFVIGCIVIIFADGKRYRGERRIAVASTTTSGVTLIGAIVMSIMKPYATIYIKPDYLYLFVHDIGEWMNQVLYVMSAIGIVISIILFAIYQSVRKNAENE